MASPPSKSAEPQNGPVGNNQPPPSGSRRPTKEEFPQLLIYEAMTEAVVSTVQEFLLPLQSTPESALALKAMTRADFFPRFFSLANKLTDECCQKLVKIIRSTSILSTVREAPVPGLAKRVRETAFKPLDEILASYYGMAKRIEVIYRNIRKIRDALEHAAMLPAPEKPAETTSPADAAGAGVEKWASENELARQHQALFQAQMQAYSRIVQYLQGLNDLPGALLSYTCDKCFAGEVNFQFERDQVTAIKAAIQDKLANALETFGRVGAVAKQDLVEERTNILTNIQMQKTHQMLEQVWEKKLADQVKANERFKKVAAVSLAGLLLLALVFFWLASARW